jgi:hypothetical protein
VESKLNAADVVSQLKATSRFCNIVLCLAMDLAWQAYGSLVCLCEVLTRKTVDSELSSLTQDDCSRLVPEKRSSVERIVDGESFIFFHKHECLWCLPICA